MDPAAAFAGILLTVLIGAISPGPSFLFVARTSLARSRAGGIAAALGMGVGGAAFALLALLGLRAVFASLPWLYAALKLGGGAYLVYIGIQMWRGSKQPLDTNGLAGDGSGQRGRAFLLALATQLSNPKTAVFYASIFAALLPAVIPLAFMVALPVAVFFLETAWYSVVALALSSAAPRSAYLRFKTVIDRTAGGVMAALGLKLIASPGLAD